MQWQRTCKFPHSASWRTGRWSWWSCTAELFPCYRWQKPCTAPPPFFPPSASLPYSSRTAGRLQHAWVYRVLENILKHMKLLTKYRSTNLGSLTPFYSVQLLWDNILSNSLVWKVTLVFVPVWQWSLMVVRLTLYIWPHCSSVKSHWSPSVSHEARWPSSPIAVTMYEFAPLAGVQETSTVLL